MVTSHGVVECLPYPFNIVNPGMIGGLKEQLEFRITRQPAPRDMTLMDDVVVDDEHDTPCPTVGALELIEQVDEQQGVFAFTLGPHHLAGARVQSAGEVVLLVLTRCRDSRLGASGHPRRTDSRVEVDVGFVGGEHLGVWVFIGQRLGNGTHSL